MVAEKGRALVVLAHGFLGGRIQLVPMASVLSRKYDVLNYSYPSRGDTLRGHANALYDTIAERMRIEGEEGIANGSVRAGSGQRPAVHFVTHSFGGAVLHRAFADGLASLLPDTGATTRCVMLAPPLRGAAFARAFQHDAIAGPDMVKGVVHAVVSRVLGQYSGAELLGKNRQWFENELGMIPEEVAVLVVAGASGRINPLIGGVSDGIVALKETVMRRRHYRVHVRLTHNLMLYSREIRHCVDSFLDCRPVGELVQGEGYRVDTDASNGQVRM